MLKNLFVFFSSIFMLFSVSGCSNPGQNHQAGRENGQPSGEKPMAPAVKQQMEASPAGFRKRTDSSVQVVSAPESISVLVNKQNKLPETYHPGDLVTLTIPYIHGAAPESRKMRQEAAEAMEKMYAAARQRGIHLLGVSAYRSHESQTSLFKSYVKTDGYQKALTYSALPGTSEHETGLAIDVTGGNGRCAAEDCFGGTKEAKWLAAHAPDFGFIIRYPAGKEATTGYQYEPWHLRYVGPSMARVISNSGITLEEYYSQQASAK